MSHRLRLLFVIDNLGSGGAQRQMVNLALGLQARGHEIEFFCYWPQNFFAARLEEAHIPVHLHVKSQRYTLEVIRQLRRITTAGQYDAVLSFLPGPNLYVLLATRGLKHCPKVIASERSYDPQEGPGWRYRLPRLLYRFADHVTVNSHHQRETLERKLPWLLGKTSTIYNGVDLTRFHPTDCSMPAVPLRLLSIGSVSPHKNGLCLVRALDILGRTYDLHPTVDWVGLLRMEAERGDYIVQMKNAIAEYHLEGQWNWLHERSDIPELMAAHHALVHPSYGEGLPNVVCEALACGLPVIISSTLDHPRLVQHGISGYLFDWHDPHDLARWIKVFSDLSDEQRAEMGRQGRAYAEEHLAMSLFVEHYEERFLSLSNNTVSKELIK